MSLPAITTPSSPRSSPRFATPRNPTRDTRGYVALAHLTRLRRAPPYPWQYDVAEVAGELRDDGQGFAYPVVVLAVPRRAGKTTLTLATGLERMDLLGDARCWYTANRREVAAKVFRDEWAPMLARLEHRYRIRRSQGSEGVHRRGAGSSSSLQLFAPTADALHSTNADAVLVDEAWSFTLDAGEELEAGIRPAQLTRPWRQTWIISAGGTIESTWLDRWLVAGENGTPGVALFDYGADADAPDYDPADPAVWARSHPTAGYGFGLDALRSEWELAADVAAFERAYLNVWPRPSRQRAGAGLELAAWSAAARPTLRLDGRPTALAFDVAGDRSSAAIAGAWRLDDGVAVKVLDVVTVGALGARIVELRRAWRGVPLVADSLVAAGVVAELARRRIGVDALGASDHARACGAFVDELGAGRLRHHAQEVLDDAVLVAGRRPLGDAWLWSRRRSTGSIAPLVAVTLAAWRAATVRPAGEAVVAVSSPSSSTRPRTARHVAPGSTRAASPR
jgi:hypothetical protein